MPGERAPASLPSIDLAYVGLGVHEQFVAYVADQCDSFREEGVHVAVRDGRTWATDRLRQGAVVGLGRTQVSRLRDGLPWVVLWANTDRPMFWIVARSPATDIGDLRGARLGVHPPGSAPGLWTRIVLRRHGLDPDHDLALHPMAPGDYHHHIQLLRTGELDAAVVGSTMSVETVAEREGLRIVAFLGDHLRVPTTGIAVDPTVIPPEDPRLRSLVAGHQRAVQTILDEPAVAIQHLRGLVPNLTAADAAAYHDRYIAPAFLRDGKPGREVVAAGLSALAQELGVLDVPDLDLDELYRRGFRSPGGHVP